MQIYPPSFHYFPSEEEQTTAAAPAPAPAATTEEKRKRIVGILLALILALATSCGNYFIGKIPDEWIREVLTAVHSGVFSFIITFATVADIRKSCIDWTYNVGSAAWQWACKKCWRSGDADDGDRQYLLGDNANPA